MFYPFPSKCILKQAFVSFILISFSYNFNFYFYTQGLTRLPGLESGGVIMAHCSLYFLGSRDLPPQLPE